MRHSEIGQKRDLLNGVEKGTCSITDLIYRIQTFFLVTFLSVLKRRRRNGGKFLSFLSTQSGKLLFVCLSFLSLQSVPHFSLAVSLPLIHFYWSCTSASIQVFSNVLFFLGVFFSYSSSASENHKNDMLLCRSSGSQQDVASADCWPRLRSAVSSTWFWPTSITEEDSGLSFCGCLWHLSLYLSGRNNACRASSG